MTDAENYKLNVIAYKRLKPEIDQNYPRKHFVAFYGGEILGDAASFWDLLDLIAAKGRDQKKVLFVRAGVDFPGNGAVLLEERPQ